MDRPRSDHFVTACVAVLLCAVALAPAAPAAGNPPASSGGSGGASSGGSGGSSAGGSNGSSALPPHLRIVSPAPDDPASRHDEMYDVEGGPAGEGEQFRLWTQLTQAEIDAVDPGYRQLVELIRTGRADKRVMRAYWFLRSRLQPYDRPVPADWRRQGHAVLRDSARTKAALETFAAHAPMSIGGAAGSGTGGSAAGASGPAGSQGVTASGPGVSPFGVWVPVGPFNIPGRMTGLDRPAGQPNVLFASAADGGLWKTTDFGATWEPLTDFEPTLSGGAVLLDPQDPNIIYFGTGEGNASGDNYPGIGVFKSIDGGKSWTQSNNFSSTVRRLAMHPDRPNRIYAAGTNGCYVSADAGATFSLISTGGLPTGERASDVIVRPDDPLTVFCAIWGGTNGGVYRTTDQGGSWTRLAAGLPPQGTGGRIVLSIAKSDPNVLIAVTDESGGTVYRTIDGGDTWANPAGGSVGHCGGQCWYDNIAGIDAGDPDVLYVGGINTYKSINGGATWSQTTSSSGGRGAANYVHVDQHVIFTPTPGEIFMANDGGIFGSTDHGANWTEWSQGLDTTQYYGICRHPSDAYWAFGGTQDNGSHRRRQGDSPEWQMRLGADGGMCMTGPTGSGIVIGEYQNLNIRRSTDDGQFFVDANEGIPGGEPHPWVGLLVADPSDRLKMWTATNKLYRVNDGRATKWKPANGPTYLNLAATAIEVAPSDSQTVYAGFTSGGLFVSNNAMMQGPTWIDIQQAGMPGRNVSRIRAHPADSQTVYVVFSGFGSGKIWKTTNGGSSFTDHTGDLPDLPVNDLVIDADNPGSLIVATDLGVFRTDDDGTSWYGWSIGLPTSAAIEFTWDSVSDTLRLGTHGRSMWQWQEASDTATGVPDGLNLPGNPLKLDLLSSGELRARWDVRACTARDYNLFYGDLGSVSTLAYDGGLCGVGSSGEAIVTAPGTSSGSVFFLLASSDGSGGEGAHGFDGSGSVRSSAGIGFCGVTIQDLGATCQ